MGAPPALLTIQLSLITILFYFYFLHFINHRIEIFHVLQLHNISVYNSAHDASIEPLNGAMF